MQAYSFRDLQAFAAALYGGRPLLLTPYAYTVTFSSIAQGATSTQSLSITANADFILTGLNYRAGTGSAQTVSNKTAAFARVLITDSGTNEQFTNSGVDLENYCTNGYGGRDLPFPRLIQGRTALNIQMTSYAPTAETYAIDLMLEGVLVRTTGQ